MTTPSDLTDHEITALLRSVVDDDSVRAPGRARIRAQILEYAAAPPDRSNVIELGGRIQPTPDRPPHGRRRLAVAAVAAAVVVVLGALVLSRNTATAPSAPASTSEVVPMPVVPLVRSLDTSAVPAELSAGTYVSSIAGGVTFELGEPVTLLVNSDARVTFGLLEPDDDSWTIALVDDAPTISLIDADPGDYRTSLSEAVDRNDLRIDPAVYRATGLRVEVTSEGLTEWDCVPEVECVVGDVPVPIVPGVENFVTPIDLDDGGGLVMLERSTDPEPSPPTAARSILDTIERSTTTP